MLVNKIKICAKTALIRGFKALYNNYNIDIIK